MFADLQCPDCSQSFPVGMKVGERKEKRRGGGREGEGERRKKAMQIFYDLQFSELSCRLGDTEGEQIVKKKIAR
jgi:hypothetical protein